MSDNIITVRNILSETASCIIQSSPYPKIDNLVDILEDVRQHLINLGFVDELTKVDKYSVDLYVHKSDKEIISICDSLKSIPSIDKLNITKVELDNGITYADDPNRKVKFGVIGIGIHTQRDHDFIDIDALTRNIANALLSYKD